MWYWSAEALVPALALFRELLANRALVCRAAQLPDGASKIALPALRRCARRAQRDEVAGEFSVDAQRLFREARVALLYAARVELVVPARRMRV